jgi:drug/metabolite transporter (DMT)-like permease
MYHYILGLTFLKSLNPYFRKYILNILNSHELLFLNTFCISIIVFLVFIYKLLFDKTFYKTIENYKKLSYGHYACIFLIAIFTVFSTLLVYDFDKNYNTPFLNSMFMKVASVVFLFLVGVFLFEEKYTVKQILGIALTIAGVYLVTSN